jgi:hypothetical protein
MSNIMKIRPVGVGLFYADGQTDRHMARLIVAFLNFVNAPKNIARQLLSHVLYDMSTYGEMEV